MKISQEMHITSSPTQTTIFKEMLILLLFHCFKNYANALQNNTINPHVATG